MKYSSLSKTQQSRKGAHVHTAQTVFSSNIHDWQVNYIVQIKDVIVRNDSWSRDHDSILSQGFEHEWINLVEGNTFLNFCPFNCPIFYQGCFPSLRGLLRFFSFKKHAAAPSKENCFISLTNSSPCIHFRPWGISSFHQKICSTSLKTLNNELR